MQVRLHDATEARLTVIAEATGLAKSDLIRRAVEDFLDQAERTGTISFAFPVKKLASEDAPQSTSTPKLASSSPGPLAPVGRETKRVTNAPLTPPTGAPESGHPDVEISEARMKTLAQAGAFVAAAEVQALAAARRPEAKAPSPSGKTPRPHVPDAPGSSLGPTDPAPAPVESEPVSAPSPRRNRGAKSPSVVS